MEKENTRISLLDKSSVCFNKINNALYTSIHYLAQSSSPLYTLMNRNCFTSAPNGIPFPRRWKRTLRCFRLLRSVLVGLAAVEDEERSIRCELCSEQRNLLVSAARSVSKIGPPFQGERRDKSHAARSLFLLITLCVSVLYPSFKKGWNTRKLHFLHKSPWSHRRGSVPDLFLFPQIQCTMDLCIMRFTELHRILASCEGRVWIAPSSNTPCSLSHEFE